MLSKRRPHAVTFAFLMAAAASFVAQGHVGSGAYGFPVGPTLSFLMLVSVLGVLLPSLIRTIRLRAWEWQPAAMAFAVFLGAELIWRWLLAPYPDVYKRAAFVIFNGELAIVALGVAAVIAEWSRHRRIRIRPENSLSVQQ